MPWETISWWEHGHGTTTSYDRSHHRLKPVHLSTITRSALSYESAKQNSAAGVRSGLAN